MTSKTQKSSTSATLSKREGGFGGSATNPSLNTGPSGGFLAKGGFSQLELIEI